MCKGDPVVVVVFGVVEEVGVDAAAPASTASAATTAKMIFTSLSLSTLTNGGRLQAVVFHEADEGGASGLVGGELFVEFA